MKMIACYSFILVLVIAALSACNDPDEPGPDGADEKITDDQRLELLDDLKDKAIELNNLETPEDRAEYLQWLSSQPHIADAGYAEEDLYAVFTDDRVAFFVRTPLNDSTGRKGGGGRMMSRPSQANSSARTTDLPKTKNVSLFSGLGQLFTDSRLGIEQAFSKVITQYKLHYLDATIENLKAVTGDAVFYITTHGGAGRIHRSDGASFIMGLYTTDPCTPENERKYKADIDSANLIYMFATYDTHTPEWRYAITDKFIENYMTFGENCLIYVDACNSSSQLPGANDVRAAFFRKATNNRATYIGWTKTTYNDVADRAATFIFERLLGNVKSEDPIQRPFDLDRVFKDLQDRGWDMNPGGGQLRYQTNNLDEVLLTPTIDSLMIDEYTSTLGISGLFGHDIGKVTIDGFPAEVIAWNPYGVVCKLKESGLGSAGNVVVHSALGHQSNPVPITEWNLKLHYMANDNGVKFSGECTLRLRADIHPRRKKPHETAKRPTHPDYGPGSGQPFNEAGSSATYFITGRKYERCNIGKCTYQFTESPKEKFGTLKLNNWIPTGSDVLALYNWGPEMKSFKINFLAIGAASTPDLFEERITCPDVPETYIPVQTSYQGSFVLPNHEIEGILEFDIADNYNIRNGYFHKSIQRPWSGCNQTGIFEMEVRWDVVTAKFAPDEFTPARKVTSTSSATGVSGP